MKGALVVLAFEVLSPFGATDIGSRWFRSPSIVFVQVLRMESRKPVSRKADCRILSKGLDQGE